MPCRTSRWSRIPSRSGSTAWWWSRTRSPSCPWEAAVRAGQVTGIEELAGFLHGRLATAGAVTAAFAAAAHLAVAGPAPPGGPAATSAARGGRAATSAARGGPAAWSAARGGSVAADGDTLAELDIELDARTAAPALRLASRRQGRALVRAGRVVWPSAAYDRLPDAPHQPIALGVTACAAGLSVEQAALAGAYGVLTVPAGAAVRLLGLDPYQVQLVLARLAGCCATVATDAVAAAGKAPAELPAHTAPLADISAELHATWEVRLFAS